MESADREGFTKDLETIFQEAMAKGKLSVALKAKEMLGKLIGMTASACPSSIKPLSQWSDEDILDFLTQLDSR